MRQSLSLDTSSRHTSSPVDGGQVAVEHDDVVWVHGGLLQRLGAVEGDVDGEAVAPQPACDRVREVALVLDQQHAHRVSSCLVGCSGVQGTPPKLTRT